MWVSIPEDVGCEILHVRDVTKGREYKSSNSMINDLRFLRFRWQGTHGSDRGRGNCVMCWEAECYGL